MTTPFTDDENALFDGFKVRLSCSAVGNQRPDVQQSRRFRTERHRDVLQRQRKMLVHTHVLLQRAAQRPRYVGHVQR